MRFKNHRLLKAYPGSGSSWAAWPSLAVVSVDRIDRARVERYRSLVEHWWKRCDAGWRAAVPVVRRDPVEACESDDDTNLLETNNLPRIAKNIAKAPLPMVAGTSRIYRLAVAGKDLRD